VNSRRLPWLLLALGATAALAALGEQDVAPAAPAHAAERAAAIRALLPRGGGTWQGGDPFAYAPVAAAPAPEPSAAVSLVPAVPAPPPWRVIGKQQDDDASWTVFLARGEDTWVVREGDTLDDGFRVAAIRPPTLTLQHATRKTRHTLDIGIARE
jgi:hypothetical protein